MKTALYVIGGMAVLGAGYYYAETKKWVPAFFTKMGKSDKPATETPGTTAPPPQAPNKPAPTSVPISTAPGGVTPSASADGSVNWTNSTTNW